MADRAHVSMTVEEFLDWDDGTETRYELVDGVPRAMNPPIANHQRVALNAATLIDAAVAGRRPCRAYAAAGVLLTRHPRANVFIPDALMTCEPIADQHIFEAPVLVVEVLSPGTRGFDSTTKLGRYGALPSVLEIWLVESRRRGVTVHAREPGGGWRAGLPHIGRASFASPVLGRAVALDALYELTPFAVAEDDDGGGGPATG